MSSAFRAKKITKDEYKILANTDMLQGNINRMCVTNDETELYEMWRWAMKRVNALYNLRTIELEEFENHYDEM